VNIHNRHELTPLGIVIGGSENRLLAARLIDGATLPLRQLRRQDDLTQFRVAFGVGSTNQPERLVTLGQEGVRVEPGIALEDDRHRVRHGVWVGPGDRDTSQL
jgi:hypothetical protein